MSKYPINEPSISQLKSKYVENILQSGWLSADGNNTKIFEETFAEYLDIPGFK